MRTQVCQISSITVVTICLKPVLSMVTTDQADQLSRIVRDSPRMEKWPTSRPGPFHEKNTSQTEFFHNCTNAASASVFFVKNLKATKKNVCLQHQQICSATKLN